MDTEKIEYHTPGKEWEKKTISFFKEIQEYGINKYFHPHPFTEEDARKISTYKGKDLYFFQTIQNEITGYAMLRGWDEGYDIPNLGIVIHPSYQRKRLAIQFMQFLHTKARQKNACKIRLKVYNDNNKAYSLYKKLGYVFSETEGQQRVGYLNL